MFKKFISMATAATLLASGLSIATANSASASAVTATIAINCDDTSNLTSANGWETVPNSSGTRFATRNGGFQKFIVINPTDVYTINITGCGHGQVVAPVNSSSANTLDMSSTGFWSAINGSTWNTSTNMNSPASLVVTGGPSIPTMSISSSRNYLVVKDSQVAISEIAITFVDSVTGANADLAQLTNSGGNLLSGFSSNTTTYSVTTVGSTFGSTRTVPSIFNQPVVRSCNGTLMADNSFDCALALGANVFTASITALNGSTTKVYTVNITRNTPGGGQTSICNAESLSPSSTIKGVTFNRGTRQANSTDFNGNGASFMGSVSLTSSEASGSGITSITSTSGTATWLYVSPSINSWSNSDISTTDNHQNVTFTNGRIFEIRITGSGCTDYYRLRVTVAGSNSGSGASTSSGAAVLGSATVAQQRQMLAAVNASKSSLSATFGNGKASTLTAFASAGLAVSSEATLARVNAKILLLPVDKRSKIEEIEKIVDLENFVERVSNAETRPSISTGQLVSRGFISADNRLKVSLTNALLSRNVTSLGSEEKIKAAIAEETTRLQERAKRTAEIKAKIAARKK